MEPVVVSVEGVSKRYRIGGLPAGYDSLREVLARSVAARLKRLRRGGGGDDDTTLWALKDVSFEVRRGEILGRVGSLLEVGTGFHPDLTGRENVYLNGAVLGMRKVEIDAKFDEIVAFSELERFIETPVKHYSSGMYVRLAFSVAADLEHEILIMDEVLAVGDMAFQQKCLDKMNDIRRQGRTIFFVSHNLPAITRLCKRAVLIEQGRLVADGQPQDVVNRYLSTSWGAGAERVWGDDAPGDAVARLVRVRVAGTGGETAAALDVRTESRIEVTYDVLEAGHALVPVVELYNEEGTEVFSTHD